ncbi:acyl-CoA thioesterase [Pseudomonas sp. LRF_L74]|uniref:acyl-CoA thioesterase n=1 Tax=Pseudomonas sp. LRF_L74 TaxID=3369422 RepID=UPI003F5DB34D
MNFAEVIRTVRERPDGLVVPELWSQGRAAFGGVVGTLLYESMRARVAGERALRSLSISFVGPMAMGEPVRLEVQVLREGRAVSQLSCSASQDGQVVAVAQGSFGAARVSSVRVAAIEPPPIKAVDACQRLPYVKGLTPEFIQFFDLHWAVGGLPFSGSTSREMGGWVRLGNETGRERIEASHLLALVDAWPSAAISLLKAPAPASSLTWTIEFIHPLAEVYSDELCQYHAHIEQASDGYANVAAALWSPRGELLAISRQTTVMFD